MDTEITGMVLAGHIAVPVILMLLIMPYMIRKLTENGYVVRDYYKPTKTMYALSAIFATAGVHIHG